MKEVCAQVQKEAEEAAEKLRTEVRAVKEQVTAALDRSAAAEAILAQFRALAGCGPAQQPAASVVEGATL